QGQTTERKRIAADLHDSLGSTMSALNWSLEAIDIKKLNPQEQEVYKHVKKTISQAHDQVRLLSHNLLPDEFEKQGLTEALRYLVRKINQNTTTHFSLEIAPQIGRFDKRVEFELYSICLELVNNILKHSKATHATIQLRVENQQLSLVVTDNGLGLFENTSDGKGLKNIKDRIESLGGAWTMKNNANGGVSSHLTLRI
ncbi:MAG TPA: two-component sensor histidine kinase, partial [Runella sp.]|nr:two-component sensor histidine kinase [Runella sp.]